MPHSLAQLQLAFAYHVVLELIRADANVDGTELAFLEDRFPRHDLRACGLVDADGALVEQFAEVVQTALCELPERLTVGEKLALVEIVAGASAADGLLVPEEADALAAVARMLGVDDRQWLEHLEGLIAAGRLRRDDAGI